MTKPKVKAPEEKKAGFYQPVAESAASVKPKPQAAPASKPTIAPARTEPLPKTRTRSKPVKSASELPPLGGAVPVDGRKTLTADANLVIDDRLLYEPQSLEAEIARIEREAPRAFGQLTQKLAYKPIAGYYCHWFNDSPGRIDAQLEVGWTAVKDSKGRPVKQNVGRGTLGSGLNAYLLKIPQKFRDQEMAARHAEAQARIGAMKNTPFRAAPGTSRPEDRDKFYSAREDHGAPLTVREPTA